MGRVEQRMYRRKQKRAKRVRLLLLIVLLAGAGLLLSGMNGSDGFLAQRLTSSTPDPLNSDFDKTVQTRDVMLPEESWYGCFWKFLIDSARGSTRNCSRKPLPLRNTTCRVLKYRRKPSRMKILPVSIVSSAAVLVSRSIRTPDSDITDSESLDGNRCWKIFGMQRNSSSWNTSSSSQASCGIPFMKF